LQYSNIYHQNINSFPTRRSSDLSEKGIRIPDAYQEAIEKWKYPEGLESYNGRITWMMDFVPDAQEDLARIRKIINSEVPLNDKRSEEHTSELQSLRHLVCRLLLE